MEGTSWTHLAQQRDQLRAVLNMVMNIQIYKLLGISSVAREPLALQEGLSSTDLVIRYFILVGSTIGCDLIIHFSIDFLRIFVIEYSSVRRRNCVLK
jgi:hypothetical protein